MSVDADIPASVDLFGKRVTDLQSDVVVGANAITGTLNMITDYTGFSSDVELQSGHYIAIHSAVPLASSATITAEIVGGISGPVTLDSDGIIVLRVMDNTTQTIRVVASMTGYESVTKSFGLTGLTLEE